MKILYSSRIASADGQYVHLRALAEALAARGHGVIMAGTDDIAAPRPLDARAGAPAWLPAPVRELGEIAWSVPAALGLAAAAQKAAPDILYERYNLFHHAGAWLARRRRLPFLLEVNAPLAAERAAHGGLAFPGLARASERAIWRAADIVLPVSGVLAREIAAAGVAPERIHVTPNGAGADFLDPADPAPVRASYELEGAIVLGFSGFLRDWHRLDRAVRYLATARPANMRLLIVGDGPARAGLERLAGDLGVAGQVIFAGVVQREAAPAHVAAFDIALQPAATAYASPLKLFEYMARARAILAPAQENIREALSDGEDALLFAPDDDAAFAAGLEALAADAGLRERLGAGARATLERRGFTWAANAARVERHALALIEEKKREKGAAQAR